MQKNILFSLLFLHAASLFGSELCTRKRARVGMDYRELCATPYNASEDDDRSPSPAPRRPVCWQSSPYTVLPVGGAHRIMSDVVMQPHPRPCELAVEAPLVFSDPDELLVHAVAIIVAAECCASAQSTEQRLPDAVEQARTTRKLNVSLATTVACEPEEYSPLASTVLWEPEIVDDSEFDQDCAE